MQSLRAEISDNTSTNINIPDYVFINTNSKTQAGGVGQYLSKELEFSRRRDLDISSDEVESCWIELTRSKHKNIIISCVHRHPRGDRVLFYDTLKKQLESSNKKGHEVSILEDININFRR